MIECSKDKTETKSVANTLFPTPTDMNYPSAGAFFAHSIKFFFFARGVVGGYVHIVEIEELIEFRAYRLKFQLETALLNVKRVMNSE